MDQKPITVKRKNKMKDILKNELYLSDINRVLDNIDLSELDNKSIIVTGGLGLICSSVVDIIHVYNEKHHSNIKIFVADINEEFFKVRYGEYKDVIYLRYNALEELDFDVPADYIIHGAGLASPELFVSKPVETMTSNFLGVKNLLDYALKHKTERFLYISSSEVYGRKETSDSFIEDVFGSCDINSVRASYSEAKRASEVLCRSYASEYGIHTVMVRPGHIYGPTASPRDQRVSSDFAFKAARGEKLELKSAGLTVRSYSYSLDCAVALLCALLNGVSGESYNIGHDEKTTIRKMSEILAKAGNVSLSIKEATEEDKKRFNPMDNATLNNDKIKSIGYKDTFSVEEGLTHTVQIIKDLYY